MTRTSQIEYAVAGNSYLLSKIVLFTFAQSEGTIYSVIYRFLP